MVWRRTDEDTVTDATRDHPNAPAPWAAHAIWWHVYPLGFVGAEKQATASEHAGGTVVAHRLGRLEAWLEYAVDLGCSGIALGPIFTSETHGYDTIDHFTVDPRLGDEDDFRHLVEAAHTRGLRILLDGVFNHVGRSFPRLADVLARGEESPHAAWFRRARGGALATFEGHESLVALNHHEPQVIDYVADVMDHWLARGADGWRLDAAYAVPTSFWRAVLDRVRSAHPNAWFVGEVIHGDYARIVQESGFDSVTQYELWKALWSSINDVNLFELAWAIERHNRFVEVFAPMTFVGNHDVTRIASQLTDLRHLPHALVALFTLAGVPSVYAGDEQAFRGVKEHRAGGDDAIRPAFPSAPSELLSEGWPVYRLHQQLAGLRRRHPWLHRATTEITLRRNAVLAYRCRSGEEQLDVVLNLDDRPVTIDAATASALAGTAEVSATTVTVPPHDWFVYRAAQ